MQENDKQIFKLRIKLKSGEEFEAEGPLSFIQQQKDDFLRLAQLNASQENEENRSYEQKIIPITQKTMFNGPDIAVNKPLQTQSMQGGAMASGNTFKTQNVSPARKQEESPNVKKYSPKPDIWGNPAIGNQTIYTPQEENPANKYTPAYFTKLPTAKPARKAIKPAEAPIPRPEGSVWDRIAYPDGPHIIIRRKDKSISTAMAALIILGSAKMLKDMPKMSALELSKSLKLSGYLKENERLDRVLAAEVKQSCLVYEGSKRNRDYIITQSGTAKAYTAAERVLLNG